MNKTDKIVEAAARRFRHYGLRKTTMQEIADDAGVAVGTLYLYFSNKDALVAACAEQFAARHRQQADALLSGRLPPDEKLRAYIVARFRQAKETRTASPHAVEITRSVLRVKPNRIQEEGELMVEVVGQILREGVARGTFAVADPDRDAKVLLYALAAFFPNALNQPQFEPREQELGELIDWFLDIWRQGARKARRSRPARPRTRK